MIDSIETSAVSDMMDVFTLAFQTAAGEEKEWVFDNLPELMGFIAESVRQAQCGEWVDYSILREQMTSEEFAELPEID